MSTTEQWRDMSYHKTRAEAKEQAKEHLRHGYRVRIVKQDEDSYRVDVRMKRLRYL